MRLYICFLIFIFSITFDYSAFAQDHNISIGLKDVLKKVYESNPTLLAARAELEETKELYPQARAGWLPTISGESSIYATDIESSNFSAGTGATTKDLTLNVNQPVWRGGRTFSETARARDLIRAGEAFLLQAEQDIFLDAVTVYMNVIRDKELLDLRIDNENIILKEYRAALERLELGDLTETDVQQTKSRHARAKSARIQAESDYDISKARFEEIVGLAPPEQLALPFLAFDLPLGMPAMLNMAEMQNPEILIAQFEQSAAEHSADARFRELLPQVSAFASINRQYDPQPGIVDQSKTETIGLRASILFYEGGAARSRVQEARRAAKRQKFEIHEVRQRIRQEVMSNWRAYELAKAQTQNCKEEIKASEAALEGVWIEAREGQRTMLDILDADQEMVDAKVGLARAKRNEVVAHYALSNSLGLLQFKTVAY